MFFSNFELKVVHIHPFWLIFCLQALFDLPDSILIVPRPQMTKKDQKSKIIYKKKMTPPAFLGFVTLGGVAMDLGIPKKRNNCQMHVFF